MGPSRVSSLLANSWASMTFNATGGPLGFKTTLSGAGGEVVVRVRTLFVDLRAVGIRRLFGIAKSCSFFGGVNWGDQLCEELERLFAVCSALAIHVVVVADSRTQYASPPFLPS